MQVLAAPAVVERVCEAPRRDGDVTWVSANVVPSSRAAISGAAGNRGAILRCLSNADRVREKPPDAAGEGALDAADGFALGLAFGDAAGDVAAVAGSHRCLVIAEAVRDQPLVGFQK